jgi:hypothetical protein
MGSIRTIDDAPQQEAGLSNWSEKWVIMFIASEKFET